MQHRQKSRKCTITRLLSVTVNQLIQRNAPVSMVIPKEAKVLVILSITIKHFTAKISVARFISPIKFPTAMPPAKYAVLARRFRALVISSVIILATILRL